MDVHIYLDVRCILHDVHFMIEPPVCGKQVSALVEELSPSAFAVIAPLFLRD